MVPLRVLMISWMPPRLTTHIILMYQASATMTLTGIKRERLDCFMQLMMVCMSSRCEPAFVENSSLKM